MNIIVPTSIYTHHKPDKDEVKRAIATRDRLVKGLPIEGNRQAIRDRRERQPKRADLTPTSLRLQGILAAVPVVCNARHRESSEAFLKSALESVNTEAHNQELTKKMLAASAGDAEAQMEIGMTVVVNAGHLIRATGTWIQWYETHSLAANAVAFLRNFVPQQCEIKVGTADGSLQVRHVSPDAESDSMVELFFLLSETVVATMFDKYKGDVSAAGLATIDISLDLAEKLDGLLQAPFIVGAPNSPFVTNFVNNGTPASHFHASARINTANFPQGNIIALADNGANTVPRFNVLRAIDDYYSRNPEGDVFGTVIHCASGIASQFGNEFTPASGNNPYTNKLAANRIQLEYNGKTYTVVPDPTMDPTDKYVLVSSNKPAGLFFDKPAGSKVVRKEDEDNNEVSSFERMLIGTAYPVTWAPRVLAIKFKS